MDTESYDQLKELRDRIMKDNERQRKSAVAVRLRNIVKKKFATTFIHAIDAFEHSFGFVWGFGKPESNLTDIEKSNRVIWNMIRKSILDIGNRQCRALLSELDLHKIDFVGYLSEFVVKSNEEDKNDQGIN